MAYQFKVQLKDIKKPPVWRRLLVPEQLTLDEFHMVIQAAFGWENWHLYQFSQQGWSSNTVYKILDPEDDIQGAEDSQLVKLSAIFTTPGQTFTYTYDFGDDWTHKITLEEIAEEKMIRSRCIGGRGACPPENCGGPMGYLSILEILTGPKNNEQREFRKWLGLGKGDEWDVNYFDIEVANDEISFIGL